MACRTGTSDAVTWLDLDLKRDGWNGNGQPLTPGVDASGCETVKVTMKHSKNSKGDSIPKAASGADRKLTESNVPKVQNQMTVTRLNACMPGNEVHRCAWTCPVCRWTWYPEPCARDKPMIIDHCGDWCTYSASYVPFKSTIVGSNVERDHNSISLELLQDVSCLSTQPDAASTTPRPLVETRTKMKASDEPSQTLPAMAQAVAFKADMELRDRCAVEKKLTLLAAIRQFEIARFKVKEIGFELPSVSVHLEGSGSINAAAQAYDQLRKAEVPSDEGLRRRVCAARISISEAVVLFAVSATSYRDKSAFQREYESAFGGPVDDAIAAQLHQAYWHLFSNVPGAFKSGHGMKNKKKKPKPRKPVIRDPEPNESGSEGAGSASFSANEPASDLEFGSLVSSRLHWAAQFLATGEKL